MIMFDTNVVSEIFRPRPEPRILTWLQALTDDVAITAVTLAELLAGVRRLPDDRRKTDLRVEIDRAVRPYRDTRSLLAFDQPAAAGYVEVLGKREHAGQPISMADAPIAAMCRFHSATCATRNTIDFARTGVPVVNPWIVS